MADKIRVAAGGTLEGKTVAVWGLTFKARTDDLRDSPSLSIINRLLAAGATVQAFDPTVDAPKPGVPAGVAVCADAYDATKDADVLDRAHRVGRLPLARPEAGRREHARPHRRRRPQPARSRGLATTPDSRYHGIGR